MPSSWRIIVIPRAKIRTPPPTELLDALLARVPKDALLAMNSVLDHLDVAKEAIGGGIPPGMVGFFTGETCPEGWSAFAEAGGRFVVAAGTLGADSYNLGGTGGKARHALTIDEMPSHDHRLGMYDAEGIFGGSHSGQSQEADLSARSDSKGTTPTGGNVPHENRPPYIALAACRKGEESFCFSRDENESFGSAGSGQFGNWSNETGDQGDWSVSSGDTPSDGVGPTDDQAGGGSYAYTEASGFVGAGNEYLLRSSTFAGGCDIEISFYYNKRGDYMGDLYLEKSVNEGPWVKIWSHLGADVARNGSDIWRFVDAGADADLLLSESDPFELRFRVVMPGGETWHSDIAIDSIRIRTPN